MMISRDFCRLLKLRFISPSRISWDLPKNDAFFLWLFDPTLGRSWRSPQLPGARSEPLHVDVSHRRFLPDGHQDLTTTGCRRFLSMAAGCVKKNSGGTPFFLIINMAGFDLGNIMEYLWW